MVNAGGRRVFVERDGTVEAVPDRTLETRNLTVAIKNIARACGDEISDAQPLLDARLEDGSRVAAMFPPCSVDGPMLTVRKFTRRYALDDLVARRHADGRDRGRTDAGRRRPQQNILISGGTGTGKTTVLNALAAHDPRPTTASCSSRRRPRFTSTSPTSLRLRGAACAGAARPGGAAAARDDRGPRCARRCGTGPIASSSARCGAPRRSTCCRP